MPWYRSVCSVAIGSVVFLVAVAPNPIYAEPCTPNSPGGTVCTTDVGNARPTQFAVGMVAVKCKQRKIEKKSSKKLRSWLKKKKRHIPTVIGPNGNYYITDRQHLAAALYRSDRASQDKVIYLRIEYNLHAKPVQSRLSMADFWTNMSGKIIPEGMQDGIQRVWPYDASGRFRDPQQLPSSVAGFENDAYRTLSRWVRDACGYIKSGKTQCEHIRKQLASPLYLEFVWANYLRESIPVVPATPDNSECNAQPYSEKCLADETGFLKKSFASALKSVASANAESYLLKRGFNPEQYGFNNSSKSVKLQINENGCEIDP